MSELHRTTSRGSRTAWLTWPGRGARIVGVLLVGLAAVGCESQAAPSPTGPTFTFRPPPASTVSVRIQGHILDADRNVPAPGTTVALEQVGVPGAYWSVNPPQKATADESGTFTMTVELPADWREVKLVGGGEGYETAVGQYISAAQVESANVSVYPSLSLGPGRSMDIPLNLGSYVCGYESELCRRVNVEAAGGPVDVEVTPLEGQQYAGLVATDNFFVIQQYQRRLTVTGNEVWIVGQRGKVRLSVAAR